MVLGAMWCYVWQPDFLKKMFYPQNGENRPSPGFFECIGKFSFFSVLYFFISLVYNESLYYCNSCMLEQISYLGKFWYLRYGPKCSWPTRLQDFSINCRTLRLAVSHKEINEINWFLVCPSNSFLRNGSLGFSDFLAQWWVIRILKNWQSPFSRKIHFWPKSGQKVFGIFWKILSC